MNKIDLPQADPERVKTEIEEIIGIDASDAPIISAKNGDGIEELLNILVSFIPKPKGNIDDKLEALIIDSWFDQYLGVVSLVRVVNGILVAGEKIKLSSNKNVHIAEKIGVFTPKRIEKKELKAGEVGFICAGVRDIRLSLIHI